MSENFTILSYWRQKIVLCSTPPDTLQVIGYNIGVKPAGSIAMTALYKSADYFREKYPETVEQLKNQSYVDDIGLTDVDNQKLAGKTKQADEVLNHANMKVK